MATKADRTKFSLPWATKSLIFLKQFSTQEYLNARIENTVKSDHGENFFLELILIKWESDSASKLTIFFHFQNQAITVKQEWSIFL